MSESLCLSVPLLPSVSLSLPLSAWISASPSQPQLYARIYKALSRQLPLSPHPLLPFVYYNAHVLPPYARHERAAIELPGWPHPSLLDHTSAVLALSESDAIRVEMFSSGSSLIRVGLTLASNSRPVKAISESFRPNPSLFSLVYPVSYPSPY